MYEPIGGRRVISRWIVAHANIYWLEVSTCPVINYLSRVSYNSSIARLWNDRHQLLPSSQPISYDRTWDASMAVPRSIVKNSEALDNVDGRSPLFEKTHSRTLTPSAVCNPRKPEPMTAG